MIHLVFSALVLWCSFQGWNAYAHSSIEVTSIVDHENGTELIRQNKSGFEFLKTGNVYHDAIGFCAVDLDHPKVKLENIKTLVKNLARFSGLIIHNKVLTPMNKIAFSGGRLQSFQDSARYVKLYGGSFFNMVGGMADGEFYAIANNIDVLPNGDGTSSVYFRSGRTLFYDYLEKITKDDSHYPMKCISRDQAEKVNETDIKVVSKPIEDQKTGVITYLACYPTNKCEKLRLLQINPRTQNAYWLGEAHATTTSFENQVNSQEVKEILKHLYKNSVVWKDNISRFSYYSASIPRLWIIKSIGMPSTAVNHLSRGAQGWNWSQDTIKESHTKLFDLMIGSHFENLTFERPQQFQHHN